VPVADGDALVLATSGTTAAPKGVVLTHDALHQAALLTSAAVGTDPERDVWLCCSPVAHAAGLGVVNRALRTATPLVVHPRFDPGAAAASGASLTALVPTVLHRIEPSAFRCILLGGMRIPEDRPPNTVATYGLTETMGGVVYDRRPLPGVEVRIGDGGAVELRSPTSVRCYRTEDGEHDPKDADGWLRTGDVGEIGSDGLLTVLGRADDVIVTGGEKVWPEDVEAVLRRLPGVGEVAVVGRPDPAWGQQVVAVVEVSGAPGTGTSDDGTGTSDTTVVLSSIELDVVESSTPGKPRVVEVGPVAWLLLSSRRTTTTPTADARRSPAIPTATKGTARVVTGRRVRCPPPGRGQA